MLIHVGGADGPLVDPASVDALSPLEGGDTAIYLTGGGVVRVPDSTPEMVLESLMMTAANSTPDGPDDVPDGLPSLTEPDGGEAPTPAPTGETFDASGDVNLDELVRRVADIGHQLASSVGRIDDLRAGYDSLREVVKNRTDQLSERVSRNEKDIAQLAERVTALETRSSSIERNLSALSSGAGGG